MSTLRIYCLFIILLSLSSCVTINVYFPAAAAEKAADQIIENVWGPEEPNTTKEIPTPDSEVDDLWNNSEQQPLEKNQSESTTPTVNKSLAPTSALSSSYWLISGLDLLIPVAYAEPNLDISTPKIQTLQARMTKRHKKLKPGYNNGAIGLTNDGLITLRAPNKVPLKSRSKIKRLINEENQDRLKLYREIARANRHPEWEAKVRATFAKRWIKLASYGWWYQEKNGQWRRK